MGDASLSEMCLGQSYDFVGQTQGEGAGTLLWHGEVFLLSSFSMTSGSYKFYDFEFQGLVDNRGVFRPGASAQVFQRPALSIGAFTGLRGLGGIFVGASKAGIATVVHVDKSPLAVRTIQTNGGSAVLAENAPGPSVPATDKRLSQLEPGLREVQIQNQKFES